MVNLSHRWKDIDHKSINNAVEQVALLIQLRAARRAQTAIIYGTILILALRRRFMNSAYPKC
jgi:hypothetical protein